MKKLTILLCAALALPAFSQTAETVSWDAAGNPPQTARLQVWRGDTVPLAPRWGSSATNGWTFASYWSTNNTEWWSKSLAPGAYDLAGDPFVWSPDMDVGARRYRLFIRASAAGGASYRANAEITMLDSPGTSPATLPAPDAWPALAAELVPFALPHLPTYAAWTNEAAARASADAGLQWQIDALAASGGCTGLVSAAASDSALRLRSADGSRILDATGGVWRVHGWNSNTLVVAFSSVAAEYEATVGTEWGWLEEELGPAYVYQYGSGLGMAIIGRVYLQGESWRLQLFNNDQPLLIGGSAPAGTYTGAVGAVAFRYAYGPGTSVTSALPGVAFMDDLSGALSGLYGEAIIDAAFVASNALAQAQAARADVVSATNALVNVYLLGTNAWIEADWSNQTVRVSIVASNGTTNTVLVGDSSSSVDPAATNLLWQTLLVGLAGKADKAWGKYAPDGAANPDSAYMTWLSAPATVFASGASWTTYGAYAALSTSGTVAFESGGDGALRIGPDSTNWFGYVAGDSVIVGAVPGGISVTAGGTEDGYAEIDFQYAGGDFPVLWFTPSLAVDFTELSGVAWVDNLDGTATVTAPATSEAGFYKATTSASWSSFFYASMPARLAGGVFGSTNVPPVVYDSVIQISSGGHTYRIPAQLVE